MARRTKARELDPLLARMMALADPSRWNIMQLLGGGSRTVGELAAASGLSLAVTSRHVQRLRSVGLVVGVKRGKELHCSRPEPESAMGRWLLAAVEEKPWKPNVLPIRERYKERSTAPDSKPSASEKNRLPYRELEDYLL